MLRVDNETACVEHVNGAHFGSRPSISTSHPTVDGTEGKRIWNLLVLREHIDIRGRSEVVLLFLQSFLTSATSRSLGRVLSRLPLVECCYLLRCGDSRWKSHKPVILCHILESCSLEVLLVVVAESSERWKYEGSGGHPIWPRRSHQIWGTRLAS